MTADPVGRLNEALAGRYVVQREIGHGGMGAVYLARDLRHERQVALKVLRPELAHSVGSDRFLREIRLTAQLDHPHILPLLDSGDAGGLLFYVMPFVEGESLRDRLDRGGPLPLEEALAIAREVAGALHHAHGRGIIHRDIKPENILLSGGHARVVDFGIARAMAAAAGDALTSTGFAIGTPAYMSPEQAGGAPGVDARSDVYSLGCVLYEMLAGRPPFIGATAQELLARHALDPIPSLAAARPGVDPSVEAALGRALAKSPADRFATAAELASAIAPAVSGSTRARSPSPVRGTRLLVPALVAGFGLAMVALFLRRPTDPGAAAPAVPRTAIAVLPFESLNTDPRYAYFASGLHDELLTQLSKVSALRVTSRTSVLRFAERGLPMREIARELGVGSVVEGTVQVEGNRLRVNVQLIDAATDGHLWADRYDRTLDDAFAIQSEVARHVVTAVGAALDNAETQGIARAPTANPEAYRLYLQGREYWLRPGRLRQDYEAALNLFERAVGLDSGFALAHAAVAEAHALIFLLRYDPSPDRVERSIAAAETAIRLAPDLPRAHEAAGAAYAIGRQDYRRGLAAMRKATEGAPRDPRLWQRIGFGHRMLGEWDSAMVAFHRATEFDPHDADLFFHLAMTQEIVGQYPEAVRSHSTALSLAPDLYSAAVARGWTIARGRGVLDSLADVLDSRTGVTDLGPLGDIAHHRAILHFWQRAPDRMLGAVRTASTASLEWELAYYPVALFAAWAHRLRGDHAAAAAAFDSAQAVITARLERFPNDWRVRVARGLVLAGRGHHDLARAEALGLADAARHPGGYFEIQLTEDRARILAQAGDADGALALLESLAGRPSWVTSHTLRLDPLWDPIRSHPRFESVVRRAAR